MTRKDAYLMIRKMYGTKVGAAQAYSLAGILADCPKVWNREYLEGMLISLRGCFDWRR